MAQILDDILTGYGIVSSFSRQLFKEKARLKEYSKNAMVFKEAGRNELEYLLISGIVHRFNITEKGDAVSTGFYMPGSIITPHFARINKKKSIFSLQAITDAVFAEIPVEELDNLRYNNREFNEFGQRIIETELSRTFFNEIVSRSYSAKERLLELRKQFPNIENLVPHHMISSYLGITNVSFSRLRNEFSRK